MNVCFCSDELGGENVTLLCRVFWQSTAEYVIRVSFGTALVASIVIVYTTIIAILSSRR